MTFLKRFKLPVLAGFFLITILFSCTEELTTIGATVIGGEPFTTDKATYNVFAYNKKIQAVRTNRLPLYQLGNFNDPIYGKTEARITSQLRLGSSNPTFGVYKQSVEDNPTAGSVSQIPENEEIDSVILYIPYMTKTALLRDVDRDGVDDLNDVDPADPNSDSDDDGVADNQETALGTDPLDPASNDSTADDFIRDNFAKTIDIDSIYGDTLAPFKFKVERSTYFLRDLDPNTGFQEAQQYFSSQQFSPSFVSDMLFEGEVTISDKEILLQQEDDPETTEIDEAKQWAKLNPGIRVKLDSDFFQTNILDKEGSSELFSQANFSDFLRGLHLSIDPTNNVMLLLDLSAANIEIFYNYEYYNTAESEKEMRNSSFILSFLTGSSQTGTISGNAVNTLNNDAYPTTILNQMSTVANKQEASRIYLKGGSGSYAEIDLFDEDKVISEDIVEQIRAENWIINEANLVFYVDEQATVGAIAPPRIYLYNAENGNIIFNPDTDFSESEAPLGQFLNFGGILDEASTEGANYKMRITSHINNMIVRDSTNATLGLVITPNINFAGVRNAMLSNSQEVDLPVGNTMTPLSTVLFGSNVEPQDIGKKLKLEIFYTKTN